MLKTQKQIFLENHANQTFETSNMWDTKPMIPDMQKCVKHSMIIVILFLCEVKNYSCGRLKKALWNQETRRCRRFRCPYMALAPQFNGPLSNSLFTDGPITTALLINGPISNGPSDQRPYVQTAFRPTALCPRLFVRGPLSGHHANERRRGYV